MSTYAEKIADQPSVWRVPVPFANVITTEMSAYVIKDGSEVLVVDTGAPTKEAAEFLGAALDELGVDPKKARWFLTHLHFDHAGLVKDFVPKEALIYASRRGLADGTSASNEALRSYVCDRFVKLGLERKHARAICAPLQLNVPLAEYGHQVQAVGEGDEITIGHYRFSVLELPGHTPGSVALAGINTPLCFSGDTVLYLMAPGLALRPDETDAVADYLESLRRLETLLEAGTIERLLIAHGPEKGSPLARIGELRGRHLGRCEEIVALVGQAERTGQLLNGAEIIKAIPWRIPYESVDQCEPLQQWSIYSLGTVLLDHCVAEGLLEEVVSSTLEAGSELQEARVYKTTAKASRKGGNHV